MQATARLPEHTPFISHNPVHDLRQTDFDSGTLILDVPGVYRLVEDIVFDPSLDPPANDAAFRLGWFAAVSIQTSRVSIDLNGHSLSQSERHRLHQRFFALIELNDQPFRPKQGPANFGEELIAPSNLLIENGHLGKSSHHAIHGNDNRRVTIRNVCIDTFEVAGIALNGADQVVIEQCRIGPNLKNVKVNSRVSQAHFLLPILDGLDGASILRAGGVTVESVREELRLRLAHARASALADEPVEEFFRSELPDGSVVGIQLHSSGVAVGPFQESWERGRIRDVRIQNTYITSLHSATREVLGFYKGPASSGASSYTAHAVMSGAFGAVLEASEVYVPNPLADGLLSAWKFGGFGKMDDWVWDWAMHGASPHSDMVGGGDSMAHIIKGTMGVFLSGVDGGHVDHVTVHDLSDANGTAVRGLVLATCRAIELEHVSVQNAHPSMVSGIESMGETDAITLHETQIHTTTGWSLVGKGITQTGSYRNMHMK